MGTLFILVVWRLYLLIVMVFILNGVSRFLFKPSTKRLLETFKSIMFSVVWPLSVFSPNGRKVLLNKSKNL